MLKIGSILAKLSGFEKPLEYLRYIFESKRESKNDKITEVINALRDI